MHHFKLNIFILILMCGVVSSANIYTDTNMRENDIYNATNINATYFYGNGSKLIGLDTVSTNYSAYSNSSDFWGIYRFVSDLNNLILSKWSNITDAPTVLSNFSDDLGDRGYTDLLNFTNSPSFYNSSDFLISDYYLGSNPFNFYNSSSPLISSSEFSGAINWTYLQNYPIACPDDTYVTQIGDSIICSSLPDYLLLSGGNMTGSIDMGGNSLHNSSWVNSTNINVTSNLYVDNVLANSYLYNQTLPAINKILSFSYYNSTSLTSSLVQSLGFYDKTEVDANISSANTSLANWADAKFVVNSGGDSLSGQYDFNGGWSSDGLSIIDGNLYAQTGYFYNISTLDVSNLAINGSLLPYDGYDNQFDVGSSALRWKDLYLGGEVFSNGTGDSYFLGNVGIGTNSPVMNLDLSSDSAVVFRMHGDNAGSSADTDVTLQMGIDNPFVTKLRLKYDQGLDIVSLGYGGNNHLTIDSSGEVGIGTASPGKDLDVSGEIRASTGILFGSDTAAANTLDDYEEGTFTPGVYDAATGGNAGSPSAANGYYTKVGNVVFFEIAILNIGTAGMTSGNNVYITNLPFTPQVTTLASGEVYLEQVNLADFASVITVTARLGSSSTIVLAESRNNAGVDFVTCGEINNNAGDIRITGHYRTTE